VRGKQRPNLKRGWDGGKKGNPEKSKMEAGGGGGEEILSEGGRRINIIKCY